MDVKPNPEIVVPWEHRALFYQFLNTTFRLGHARTDYAERVECNLRGVRAGDRIATLLHNGAASALLPHATARRCGPSSCCHRR